MGIGIILQEAGVWTHELEMTKKIINKRSVQNLDLSPPSKQYLLLKSTLIIAVLLLSSILSSCSDPNITGMTDVTVEIEFQSDAYAPDAILRKEINTYRYYSDPDDWRCGRR